MPPKKQPKTGQMLSCNVAISSFRASLRTSAVHRRGEEPEIDSAPWLEFRGAFEEPVKGRRDVEICVYPREPLVVGKARPASVGAITGMRPQVVVVLTWSHQEFDRLWTFALSGSLKFAHLYMTKPHYNTGLVVSASFSTEREE